VQQHITEVNAGVGAVCLKAQAFFRGGVTAHGNGERLIGCCKHIMHDKNNNVNSFLKNILN